MLTLAQIEPYLRPNIEGHYLHANRARSVKIRNDLREVFGEAYPKYLNKNRPKETTEVKKYRNEIYENIFIDFPDRVAQKIDKIQQSDDFIVAFPEPELKQFCEKEFGVNSSLQSWVFNNAIRWYLMDPNAVVAIIDVLGVGNEKEYDKPLPIIFGCEQVAYFDNNRFAALLSEQKTDIVDLEGKVSVGKGNVWYFFDTDTHTIARQTKLYATENGWVASYDILGLVIGEDGSTDFVPLLHQCAEMPVMKIGQVVEQDFENGNKVYKSLLTNALPFIRNAQWLFNSLQIEFNFHINSREWLYDLFKCPNQYCNNGKLSAAYGEHAMGSTCPTCGGTGRKSLSSAETVIVHTLKGEMGGKTEFPPVPPGGFIERSIEPAKVLIEHIETMSKKAWQAINMKSNDSVAINISGRARELEGEYENTQLRYVANFLVNNLIKKIVRWVSRQRYGKRIGIDACDKMLPEITVPFNFNLLDAKYIQEELNNAKDKGLSPVLIGKLTLSYMEKSFGKNSVEVKIERLAQVHDILYGLAIADKTLVFGGGKGSPMMGITLEDYIISVNVYGFLQRAFQNNVAFDVTGYEAQRIVLAGYAGEVIRSNPEPIKFEQPQLLDGRVG